VLLAAFDRVAGLDYYCESKRTLDIGSSFIETTNRSARRLADLRFTT